jgi:hypothetical protein
MQLSDYIGQVIALTIPAIDANTIQSVKLLGVETGGIWVESQKLLNMALKTYGLATSETSLAFFFPYHEIRFGYVEIDGPALGEEALGV